jgi:hypothetical protein
MKINDSESLFIHGPLYIKIAEERTDNVDTTLNKMEICLAYRVIRQ